MLMLYEWEPTNKLKWIIRSGSDGDEKVLQQYCVSYVPADGPYGGTKPVYEWRDVEIEK